MEADNNLYFGDDFGQKIDLTVRIREILRNYPGITHGLFPRDGSWLDLSHDTMNSPWILTSSTNACQNCA